MEKVTGIGGFFFRCANPDQLNEWYETHLGVRRCGQTYEEGAWWQSEGPIVLGGDPPTQGGRATPIWRVNFRVSNLDAMVNQLRSAGIQVSVEDTIYPNGRFAHLVDPEGNPIELWEPNDAAMIRPTGV